MLRKIVLLLAGLMLVLSIPAQASVIDTSQTGTIELNFLHPNPHDDKPGHSAEGVGTRVQRVTKLDLSTNEGWRAAEALDTEDVLSWEDSAFDVDRTGYSNSRGVLTFTHLPLGLYRVIPLADGTFDPFVVTVPVSSGTGEWDYVIDVYPKVPRDSDDPGAPGDKDGEGGEEPSESSTSPTTGLTAWPESIPPADSAPGGMDDDPNASDSDTGLGALASTGASVMGLVGAGFLLLTIGVYLIIRKRQGEGDE